VYENKNSYDLIWIVKKKKTASFKKMLKGTKYCIGDKQKESISLTHSLSLSLNISLKDIKVNIKQNNKKGNQEYLSTFIKR
jgi:FlaG/FlaF family flagellin (archaellin)